MKKIENFMLILEKATCLGIKILLRKAFEISVDNSLHGGEYGKIVDD
jgi:hypothetical protein